MTSANADRVRDSSCMYFHKKNIGLFLGKTKIKIKLVKLFFPVLMQQKWSHIYPNIKEPFLWERSIKYCNVTLFVILNIYIMKNINVLLSKRNLSSYHMLSLCNSQTMTLIPRNMTVDVTLHSMRVPLNRNFNCTE